MSAALNAQRSIFSLRVQSLRSFSFSIHLSRLSFETPSMFNDVVLHDSLEILMQFQLDKSLQDCSASEPVFAFFDCIPFITIEVVTASRSKNSSIS